MQLSEGRGALSKMQREYAELLGKESNLQAEVFLSKKKEFEDNIDKCIGLCITFCIFLIFFLCFKRILPLYCEII